MKTIVQEEKGKMNRTDIMELELNKSEARLLHNIIADWYDRNIETENTVLTIMASDIAKELYNELKGEPNDFH